MEVRRPVEVIRSTPPVEIERIPARPIFSRVGLFCNTAYRLNLAESNIPLVLFRQCARYYPMKPNRSAWDTHDWTSRRFEISPGLPVVQQDCRNCRRTFVDEFSTGARYAVYVSVFIFHRLSDEVTARWLSEDCPTKRLYADAADRQTRGSQD